MAGCSSRQGDDPRNLRDHPGLRLLRFSLTELFPSSVIGIGEYAFIGCSGLAQLVISSSVTTIGLRFRRLFGPEAAYDLVGPHGNRRAWLRRLS